jgi:hypothetical protein
MATSESGRIIMRIEVSRTAAELYIVSADDRGMTHIATTSRIIEWFTGQSEEVQAAILGNHPLPPSDEELTRLITKRMKEK